MYKILLLNGLFCALSSLKYHVIGQENENNEMSNLNITIKRFIIEDDFKPPIFGSYKYNPIARVFELPEGTLNRTESRDNIMRVNNLKNEKDKTILKHLENKFLRDGVIDTEERNTAKEKKKFVKNPKTLVPGKGKPTKINNIAL